MSDADVKKISDNLAEEITQKHDLKHAETVEKNVLPTAEGTCKNNGNFKIAF